MSPKTLRRERERESPSLSVNHNVLEMWVGKMKNEKPEFDFIGVFDPDSFTLFAYLPCGGNSLSKVHGLSPVMECGDWTESNCSFVCVGLWVIVGRPKDLVQRISLEERKIYGSVM